LSGATKSLLSAIFLSLVCSIVTLVSPKRFLNVSRSEGFGYSSSIILIGFIDPKL